MSQRHWLWYPPLDFFRFDDTAADSSTSSSNNNNNGTSTQQQGSTTVGNKSLSSSSSSSSDNNDDDNDNDNELHLLLPYYGEFILKAYNTIPKYDIPFLNISISFAIVSMVFFIIIRIITTIVMINIFNWPKNLSITTTAASSIPSIIHATLLCPGLIIAFLTHKYVDPSEHLSKANPKWQLLVSALLEFCTGYMINDSFFLLYYAISPTTTTTTNNNNLLLDASDIRFLFHHILCILYMNQARYYKAGHISAMIGMLLGELSNPFMNTFGIVKYASEIEHFKDGMLLQQLQKFVPICYSIIFLMIRVIIGPIILIKMTKNLLFSQQGKDNIPLLVRILWSIMIWGVMFLSIPLILDCINIVQTYINNNNGGQDKQQEL